MRSGLLFFILCASLLQMGCFGTPVGSTCSSDEECSFGSRCLNPGSNASASVCTFDCTDGGCEGNTQCTATEVGNVCLAVCESSDDCDGPDLRCQQPKNGLLPICWELPDAALTALGNEIDLPPASGPGRVKVLSIEVDDTQVGDGNGLLSAGETATISLIGFNPGVDDQIDVTAGFVFDKSLANVTFCKFSGQSCVDVSTDTTDGCDCHNTNANQLDLLAGQADTQRPLVTTSITVAPGIAELPFDVEFNVGGELRFTERFVLPLHTPQSSLVFDHLEIIDDEDGDGILTRGEWTRIDIYARNDGSEKVVNARPILTIPQPLNASFCKSNGSDCSESREDPGEPEVCDCNPQNTFDSNPGEVFGPVMTMQMQTQVGQSPVNMPLVFIDGFGNRFETVAPLGFGDSGADVALREIVIEEGSLIRGGTTKVEFFLRNNGTSEALQLISSLTLDADGGGNQPGAQFCKILGRDCSTSLGACDCSNRAPHEGQSIEPVSDGNGAVLSVQLSVPNEFAPNMVTGTLVIVDKLGSTWTFPFSLAVSNAP